MKRLVVPRERRRLVTLVRPGTRLRYIRTDVACIPSGSRPSVHDPAFVQVGVSSIPIPPIHAPSYKSTYKERGEEYALFVGRIQPMVYFLVG